MSTITALPLPPKEYDPEYMNRLVKQLNIVIQKLTSVGPLTVGSDLTQQNAGYLVPGLTILNMPRYTEIDRLPPGSLYEYYDGSVYYKRNSY